ncbi:MAG: hypothetical protein PUE05_07265, partial [bacterium]|nr:hypothetical protein [bacterium]
IHPDTHVAWMLRHDDAIVFIQIKHSVFGCKVHNQKRHLKVGLFRMVTNKLPSSMVCRGQRHASEAKPKRSLNPTKREE